MKETPSRIKYKKKLRGRRFRRGLLDKDNNYELFFEQVLIIFVCEQKILEQFSINKKTVTNWARRYGLKLISINKYRYIELLLRGHSPYTAGFLLNLTRSTIQQMIYNIHEALVQKKLDYKELPNKEDALLKLLSKYKSVPTLKKRFLKKDLPYEVMPNCPYSIEPNNPDEDK